MFIIKFITYLHFSFNTNRIVYNTLKLKKNIYVNINVNINPIYNALRFTKRMIRQFRMIK